MIAPRLLDWYDRHGRSDLPWQHPRTPYRVWLSEVMLQQTQVATVIGYFERFVAALPDLVSLAAAPQDDVLALWAGLGYYSRARNLHRAAKLVVERHGGELPADIDALSALPGIGRSTAGAILAQAWGLRHPILDGNVKRVLSRHRGVHGWAGASRVADALWAHAEENTPYERLADYTQAIMDLGATVCVRSRPRCATCPVGGDCIAHRDGLTAQLPTRKPARRVPTRQTCMLILRDARGRVLLEKRPPAGVWAELWSLPETESPDAAPGAARRAGAKAERFEPLDPFVHAFTHYRLEVSPYLAQAEPLPRVADGDRVRWCGERELAALGLPAPVKKLLQTLHGGTVQMFGDA